MDHLGTSGSLLLLSKLGYPLPSDDFVQWAIQQLPAAPEPLPGRVMRLNIYAVAEYSISGTAPPPPKQKANEDEDSGEAGLDGPPTDNGEGSSKAGEGPNADGPLEGALLYQSGFRPEEPREGPGWLSDIPLPIARYVDRALCAEFQLLSELSELQVGGAPPGTQDQNARQAQKGRVDFWVTHPPCLSCISALLQYNTLFPGVKVCVAVGGHLAPGSGGPAALDSVEDVAPAAGAAPAAAAQS
eukprot:gnl/MRDRNA2_/MRDRNA2_86010_c0_seq2.p1 gnl/MRDRNA2_/MRDRNA2_86010_c0~~gnl/MRDRNA2_/MRDRNA2_86010_c0_seq2.p1  ORF type:complete len:243 (+),score=51.93 gnl/MRDRNA2_/MRDRNA2_86010_c0_seq2:759-1487(+)